MADAAHLGEEEEEPIEDSIVGNSADKKPKKKKKKKKKPPPVTDAASGGVAVPAPGGQRPPKPLFGSVQSRSGTIRPDYGTNDTTTMLEPIPTKVVAEQLDTVLQAVRQLDTTCDFPRCVAKTTLMYLDCPCCPKRFCFKHGLPEVHGCSEAIRQAERAEFRRPVPVKTRRAEEDVRRAQQRMTQRLEEMSLARKAKPKGGGGDTAPAGGGAKAKKK